MPKNREWCQWAKLLPEPLAAEAGRAVASPGKIRLAVRTPHRGGLTVTELSRQQAEDLANQLTEAARNAHIVE